MGYLQNDGILVLPTMLGSPPKLNGKEILSADYQLRTLCLSAIASMSGCCQVTIPLGVHENFLLSVSFIARQGGDHFLLDTVYTMCPSLQEQVSMTLKSSISSKSTSKEESADIAKEGNVAFKEKQWQKAINLYTEAIKLNEKNVTYYSNRAAAYLEIGGYLQAEADCNKAISIDKKSVKSYLRRGTAREMLGYYKEAIFHVGEYKNAKTQVLPSTVASYFTPNLKVRREKISERMKYLQDLVPGCNNITGKASVLDEIINYVQSLHKQVELLSMKLAYVDRLIDCNKQSFMEKEISSACSTSISRDKPSDMLNPSSLLFTPL